MPSPADVERARELGERIRQYNARQLPGLAPDGALDTLAAQMVDSLRRVEFAYHLRDANHDPARSNPNSPIFDPLRAAVLANRQGDVDNASWLTFLGTHFGKHSVDGWRLARDVYGRLQEGPAWAWSRIRDNFDELEQWLPGAINTMQTDGISRRFSNHRKYESLTQIGDVLRTYRDWVLQYGSHSEIIRSLHREKGQNPAVIFDELYRGMDTVQRFGRLAKFDYLTMLGKLGISPIEPGSAYLSGATGPLRGARLLFTGNVVGPVAAPTADHWVSEFGTYLELGMQVMEDSLCNWQKSPQQYVRFKG